VEILGPGRDLPMSATETETPIPTEILSAVLALNDKQRLALGHRLIESVEDVPNDSHPDWPEGWEEELERRALAVERGEPTFSHEEVIAYARESVRQARLAKSASDSAS
jgi:Putative addiction module component